jgi:antitoxin (DNA-binding transcriptional repressor) of toxin-antitoxin stability system
LVTINLSEAKAHLGKYVAKASGGEVIIICQRNKPLAELRATAASFQARKLKIGGLKGKFKVPDDFNAPLPQFEAAFYERPTGKRKPRSSRSDASK